MREQSLIAREKDYEIQARERGQALADSRKRLLSTLRMLESERQTANGVASRVLPTPRSKQMRRSIRKESHSWRPRLRTDAVGR